MKQFIKVYYIEFPIQIGVRNHGVLAICFNLVIPEIKRRLRRLQFAGEPRVYSDCLNRSIVDLLTTGFNRASIGHQHN